MPVGETKVPLPVSPGEATLASEDEKAIPQRRGQPHTRVPRRRKVFLLAEPSDTFDTVRGGGGGAKL